MRIVFLAAALIVSAGSAAIAQAIPSAPNPTSHYPALSQRGGANEILLVKGAEFRDGDEIAVRTSKKVLAGTGVVSNGAAVVTVWPDDVFTTDVVEGAVEGEALSISHWSKADNKERALAISSIADGLSDAPVTTGLVFTANAVTVVRTAAIDE